MRFIVKAMNLERGWVVCRGELGVGFRFGGGKVRVSYRGLFFIVVLVLG